MQIAIVIIILAAIILIVIVIMMMIVTATKTPSSVVWQRENLNKHIHIIHYYYMILISTAERFENEKCVNIILHNAGSLNRCCALGQLEKTVARLE